MKEPVEDAVQERVEVPEVVVVLRVILVVLRVQVKPVEGDTVSDNTTLPLNPLIPETVTVDVPDVPTTKLTLVGLAATVKSGGRPTL